MIDEQRKQVKELYINKMTLKSLLDIYYSYRYARPFPNFIFRDDFPDLTSDRDITIPSDMRGLRVNPDTIPSAQRDLDDVMLSPDENTILSGDELKKSHYKENNQKVILDRFIWNKDVNETNTNNEIIMEDTDESPIKFVKLRF